jgi:hypothetical protein
MSAASDALEAAGGSLELRIVKRGAVERDDGSLRFTMEFHNLRAVVQLDLIEASSLLLDASDCRQLAAKLTGLARQLEELR